MRRGESKAKSLKRGGRIRSAPAKAKARAGHKDASSGSLAIQLAAKTRELNEALAQQAATADVLKAIGRSTFDLQTVLNTLVESAGRLCEADRSVMNQFDESASISPSAWPSRTVAFWGYWPERIAVPTGRGSTIGRAIAERRSVQIPDVLADADYEAKEAAKAIGLRTTLAVPLMREGAPIGFILLQRRTVRPFTNKQIELVETFADQAVIAIGNVRLFDEVQARTREVTEALEQQTATSEVLQVISSSPGEIDPVFRALLEKGVRICGAKFGTLTLYDGSTFRNAALHKVPPDYAATWSHEPFRPHPQSGLGYVARTKQIAHIHDIRTQSPYLEGDPAVVALADLAGARTLLIVPMLKESALIGTIAIFRQEVRPFTDKQIELLSNFARQAVMRLRTRACSRSFASALPI
jgi:GAF domain-containing protein